MNLHQYWWPVAESVRLRGSPLARMVLGIPIVLFREERGAVAALLDRCPHRHVPLSAGRVQKSQLVCCYHGWRFDRDGVCVGVPGLAAGAAQTKPIVPAFAVCEAQKLIWINLESSEPKPASSVPSQVDDEVDRFILAGEVESTIPLASENFLDGTHTHFVHTGSVRRDEKRKLVKAQVRQIPDGIEAEYGNEASQSGWISRMLERDRVSSFGRFRLPGIAEIEYRGRSGMTLKITAYLTPKNESSLYTHAVVMTPRGLLPASVKSVILRRLFNRIFSQDRDVLALQQRNRLSHADAEFVDSPLDLLGPSIRRLMNGEPLDPGVERTQDLWI